MGGKGKRRREKNYRSAHGGQHSVLPPPPDPSQVDAIPSKLRHLISLSSNPPNPNFDKSKRADRKRPREDATAVKDGSNDHEHLVTSETVNLRGEAAPGNGNEKKKKKRKKNQASDLRFLTELDKGKTVEKRKERKRKYLESKKKKHKNPATEEKLEFPGREQIKFGDVVQAPPKLTAIPKKPVMHASQERLRLQAIEAYRKRKGWGSRPGLQLPPVAAAVPPM